MSRSNWQRNQDWETIARLRKRIAELEAGIAAASLTIAAQAERLGQQAVRIEELEAQRKWAADRASYWQDIANNLERQVKIYEQIVNL